MIRGLGTHIKLRQRRDLGGHDAVTFGDPKIDYL